MLGLKTQESKRFERFFQKVQEAAGALNKIFFLECEDGHDKDTDDMEMCDLQGWLVAPERISSFVPIWNNNDVDDEWNDEFCFAVWDDSDGLKIRFLNEF